MTDPAAAPLRDDLALGPPGGFARWLHTADGVRLRLGVWPEGARGTVLLFPGRTEYVEKYGPAAADLAARGYACVTLDWRGQGLADRPLPDRRIGHVAEFADYQHDVAALVAAVTGLDLPRPWYLLAHSMGGAIGLRAVTDGLPVAACAFTGPMWGILLPPLARPLAPAIARMACAMGLGHRLVPTTGPQNYVATAAFAGNVLTTHAPTYAWMQAQLMAAPELALGGPSLHWLDQALRELGDLARRPAPALPCLTLMGGRERVVDPAAIRARMAAWPGGRLIVEPEAEHEILMEAPDLRHRAFDALVQLFDRAATGATPVS